MKTTLSNSANSATPPDPQAAAMLKSRPKRLDIEARHWPDLHDAITAQGGAITEAHMDGNRVRVCLTWPRKRNGVKP